MTNFPVRRLSLEEENKYDAERCTWCGKYFSYNERDFCECDGTEEEIGEGEPAWVKKAQKGIRWEDYPKWNDYLKACASAVEAAAKDPKNQSFIAAIRKAEGK